MSKAAIIGVLLLIIVVVGAFFLINEAPAQNTTATQTPPPYEKHTVVCPNPDCVLHDPNYKGEVRGEVPRDIDMEYSGSAGFPYYLCHECGEVWRGT